MKRKIVFVGFILSTVFLMPKAYGSDAERTESFRRAESVVREQVVRLVSREDIGTENGSVSIVFSSYPTIPFRLMRINGNSQELVDRVKERLDKYPLTIPEVMRGGTYSITIRFSDIPVETKYTESGSLLRQELFSVLSGAGISESGLVKILVAVKNGKATLIKIDGNSKSLTGKVEDALNIQSMNVLSEASGVYEVPVRF